MFRYLINLSYIGTSFRGAQIQNARTTLINDPTTIQGQIEIVLKKLQPINAIKAVISSRTDSGVHALHTTMHVDLEHWRGTPYDPRTITIVLNEYFCRNPIPIRILKTYLVPNDFHCRSGAISRTYLYRITVINADVLHKSMMLQYLPIQELDRSYFISTNTFDVDKFREAAQLFVGLHDFRTFMHKSIRKPNKITRRIIDKIEIRETQPLCSDGNWPFCVSNNRADYKTYDIVLKGEGFLYRQVRRTVASLIAVAKGIVTPSDIKFMLEIPSHRSWNPRIVTVPAHGLYLAEVAYSQQDLETFKEQLESTES